MDSDGRGRGVAVEARQAADAAVVLRRLSDRLDALRGVLLAGDVSAAKREAVADAVDGVAAALAFVATRMRSD